VLLKYAEKRITIEEAINEVVEYVNGFKNQGVLVVDRELGDKLRSLTDAEIDAVVLQAWKDVLVLKESLDLFVYKEKRE